MHNESHFKNLVTSKIGNHFKGKLRLKKGNVEISTDEQIETKDFNLLIEVDSGNYAKLIVGQYTLINSLINLTKENEKTPVFLIVHYHNRNSKNPYNSARTKHNLDFVNKNVFNKNGIKFIAYNLKEFTLFIKDISSVEELNQKIKTFLKNEQL